MQSIIVVGSNYATALGVVRSIGMAGYNVRFLAQNKDCYNLLKSSRYVEKCERCNTNWDSTFSGLEKLREMEKKNLILPTSDIAVYQLINNVEKIEGNYSFPNLALGKQQLNYLLKKENQKKLAKEAGLSIPEGYIYNTNIDDIHFVLNKTNFPCVMKAASSVECLGTKELFNICNNKAELKEAIEKAKYFKCEEVIIEDYIKADNELCIYGVAFNDEILIPACLITLRSGRGRHIGVTAEGIMTKSSLVGEDLDRIKTFIRKSKIEGLFCIDIIESDGKLYFIELNLRYGSSGFAVTLGGANLPKAYVDSFFNTKIEDNNRSFISEVHFINEKVELDDYRSGIVTWKQYRKQQSNNLTGLIRWDEDMHVWREFKILEKRKRLAKLIKK